MRFAASILALFVGVLGFAAGSSAIERTAYVIDAYGHMTSGVLPTSPGSMQLTTIADFGKHLVGSTMDSAGSLLTMFAETDELVRINPATLEYQVLHTLAIDIVEFDDLVFGPTGDLLLLHGGFLSGSSSLYDIDPETGDLSDQAILGLIGDNYPYHQTLEIVERTTPIPTLRPTGVAILVTLLGLAGTLAIRRL